MFQECYVAITPVPVKWPWRICSYSQESLQVHHIHNKNKHHKSGNIFYGVYSILCQLICVYIHTTITRRQPGMTKCKILTYSNTEVYIHEWTFVPLCFKTLMHDLSKWNHSWMLTTNKLHFASYGLTNCCLVTPDGDIDIDRHWLR